MILWSTICYFQQCIVDWVSIMYHISSWYFIHLHEVNASENVDFKLEIRVVWDSNSLGYETKVFLNKLEKGLTFSFVTKLKQSVTTISFSSQAQEAKQSVQNKLVKYYRELYGQFPSCRFIHFPYQNSFIVVVAVQWNLKCNPQTVGA